MLTHLFSSGQYTVPSGQSFPYYKYKNNNTLTALSLYTFLGYVALMSTAATVLQVVQEIYAACDIATFPIITFATTNSTGIRTSRWACY